MKWDKMASFLQAFAAVLMIFLVQFFPNAVRTIGVGPFFAIGLGFLGVLAAMEGGKGLYRIFNILEVLAVLFVLSAEHVSPGFWLGAVALPYVGVVARVETYLGGILALQLPYVLPDVMGWLESFLKTLLAAAKEHMPQKEEAEEAEEEEEGPKPRKCKACKGEVTDPDALHCPQCGKKL